MIKKYFIIICFLILLFIPALSVQGNVGNLNIHQVTLYNDYLLNNQKEIRKDQQVIKRIEVLNNLDSNKLISTKIQNMDSRLQDSTLCLALNIYFEARGSSTEDMIGTSLTVFSRLLDGRYINSGVKNNVCNVIFATKQYSWTNQNKIPLPKEKPAWQKAQAIAYLMMTDKEILNKVQHSHYKHYVATSFYKKEIEKFNNPWYKKAIYTRELGAHTYLLFDNSLDDFEQIKITDDIIIHTKTRFLTYLNLEHRV